jgi:FKBP-type peptidyl-prolyl cis-trans isomerase
MGVEKKTVTPGDGNNYPQKGQSVTVHYKGLLTNGKQFDSSLDRREPFKFQIGMGQVIKGWDEGVATMSLGELATLVISPDFGYGARGSGNDIPPNAMLIFHVQLLGIDKKLMSTNQLGN